MFLRHSPGRQSSPEMTRLNWKKSTQILYIHNTTTANSTRSGWPTHPFSVRPAWTKPKNRFFRKSFPKYCLNIELLEINLSAAGPSGYNLAFPLDSPERNDTLPEQLRSACFLCSRSYESLGFFPARLACQAGIPCRCY